MFTGVSGNAPFLETYWRHRLLTYPGFGRCVGELASVATRGWPINRSPQPQGAGIARFERVARPYRPIMIHEYRRKSYLSLRYCRLACRHGRVIWFRGLRRRSLIGRARGCRRGGGLIGSVLVSLAD